MHREYMCSVCPSGFLAGNCKAEACDMLQVKLTTQKQGPKVALEILACVLLDRLVSLIEAL